MFDRCCRLQAFSTRVFLWLRRTVHLRSFRATVRHHDNEHFVQGESAAGPAEARLLAPQTLQSHQFRSEGIFMMVSDVHPPCSYRNSEARTRRRASTDHKLVRLRLQLVFSRERISNVLSGPAVVLLSKLYVSHALANGTSRLTSRKSGVRLGDPRVVARHFVGSEPIYYCSCQIPAVSKQGQYADHSGW